MPSTTTYDAGDVLLVDYLHTDGTQGGRRPVVVLSARAHNEKALDVVVAQISSQLQQKRLPGSVLLQDWKEAGLIHESLVKPVFASYPHSRIRKPLGHLSRKDLLAVRRSVAAVLGFKVAPRP